MPRKTTARKPAPDQNPDPSRRIFVLGAAGAGAAVLAGGVWALMPSPSHAGDITVYKSASCGCCGKWADHMRHHGYNVVVRNTDEMDSIKLLNGVPDALQSCHTATIDGYVIEGHVPAKEVTRLLSERPKAAGISVPGMPTGSPGMEGGEPERYQVVLFDKSGKRQIFARY